MSSASTQAQPRTPAKDAVALVSAYADTTPVINLLRAQRLPITMFDDVDALLEHDMAGGPAVILVCVADPAASLSPLVEPLARHFAQVPIVVVGPSLQRRAIRAALAAGAAGVVCHDELDSALGPCILAVLAGQVCVPRHGWQEIEPPALSSREKQVLGLVVMGYMNSQIAQQLFLAESTVKSHLSSAFDKLGVRSRHEAVARILDPNGGLGVGILTLSGESLDTVTVEAP
jgi:DNA-binding NarL/FixJ family response regulator